MTDRTVTYRLRADLGQFRAQMAQAGAATKKAANDMTSMEKSAVKSRQGLATLGSAAGKVGLVAAAGLGAAVVKAADFDAAMSQVRAATGETATNMDKLRQAALDAGAETAFSATEAAAGVTELAKAGISTNDILSGGLMGSLDLAAAGQIEVGEAAEYAAKAMSQFSLTGDQVPHIADLLAAAAGKAVGEVGDFGQALNQVGLVASQAGLSIEDTVGTLAAFSQAGSQGSDAGTAFKSMLQRLQNPIGQGAKAMERFGISAYDTQGNFVGITNVADQLQQKLAGVDQATRDAALAQIFGSDAVRAANVLYREGATGLQKWIDQTNDSGFAAEQAAIKLDNLKGDLEALGGSLETALIGTGDGAQTPLRSLTQGLTDAINAYNRLGPTAQNATALVLGGAAAVGGSIWVGTKLINGVASAREAFESLGPGGAKAAGAIGKLSKAAGIATAALGALAAVDFIQGGMKDYSIGVESMTASILDMNDAASGSLPKNLDGLTDSIERLANPGKMEALQDSISNALGGIGNEEEYDRAVAQIDAIEAALTGLVQSGNQAAAEDWLSGLDLSDAQMAHFLKLMPDYREALTGAANQAKLAGGAQDQLASGTDKAAKAAARQAEAARQQAAAIKEARGAARETATSFFNLGNAIKDGKQSLGSFLRNLEDQADALRDFRLNAERAAKKGLDEGLIASLREAGPEGARQMRQLASATDAEIKRANKAWRSGQAEIRQYTNDVGGVPNSVSTDVNVTGVDTAIAKVDALGRELNLLPRYQSTTVHTVFTSSGKRFKDGFASGGLLSGPGTATSDSIPIWGSTGEFMMRAAAVDKYGPDFMHAVNSLRYAEGGMVGSAPGSPSVSVAAPNVSVGGPSVRVFLDGREIDARVESRFADHTVDRAERSTSYGYGSVG